MKTAPKIKTTSKLMTTPKIKGDFKKEDDSKKEDGPKKEDNPYKKTAQSEENPKVKTDETPAKSASHFWGTGALPTPVLISNSERLYLVL